MTLRQKIYIAATIAAVIAVGILVATAWSDYRLSRLEAETDAAVSRADAATAAAADAERRASQYIAKIEYLERQLAGVRQLANKQDEELQKLNTDTRTARSHVDAVRGLRTAAATAVELCQKLADVGYPC